LLSYVDITEQLKSMGEFFWQALAVDSYLSGMFIKSYMIENEEVIFIIYILYKLDKYIF